MSDDLKKLAEAYPRIAAIQAEVDLGETLLTLTPEIHELLDLAAQLYASNRALNERIGKARYLLENVPIHNGFRGWEERIRNWLAADDDAQRKG